MEAVPTGLAVPLSPGASAAGRVDPLEFLWWWPPLPWCFGFYVHCVFALTLREISQVAMSFIAKSYGGIFHFSRVYGGKKVFRVLKHYVFHKMCLKYLSSINKL